MKNNSPEPVKKRLKVLDALRGFALLGVCLANYKELTLYAFYDVEHTTNVQGDSVDDVVNSLMYALVDGKFYTIFSILFGIGFSIIIANAGSGARCTYGCVSGRARRFDPSFRIVMSRQLTSAQ